MLGGTPLTEMVESGKIQMERDPSAFASLVGAAAAFTPDFTLVPPPDGTPDAFDTATLPEQGSGD